jgi:DNA-directed RNA polymerase specialized sigma24 family protein
MMERFFEEFRVLLDSGSPSGISMLAFIKRSLKQFNLLDSYSAYEILSDAFIRGVERIKRGERIENTLAWIRVTAFNIIREYSRSSRRFSSLEESWFESGDTGNAATLDEFLQQCEWIKTAFAMLNADDRELLMLKICENLSWKNIVEQYHERGFLDVNEATLRKRKERTLKRLRKIYHLLELQNIIQNQLVSMEANKLVECEPSMGKLNKEILTRWRQKMSEYQLHSLVRQSHHQCGNINPFSLPGKSMSSLRSRDRDFQGKSCLYFICDTAANIILYVGTIGTSESIPGMYDCSRYIECYEDLNSEHGFRTTIKIAYWQDIPEFVHTPHELVSMLIDKWKTPFNKQNWL